MQETRLYAWVEERELEGLVRVTWDRQPGERYAFPLRIQYWKEGFWRDGPWLVEHFIPGLLASPEFRSDRVAEVDEAYALRVQAAEAAG